MSDQPPDNVRPLKSRDLARTSLFDDLTGHFDIRVVDDTIVDYDLGFDWIQRVIHELDAGGALDRVPFSEIQQWRRRAIRAENHLAVIYQELHATAHQRWRHDWRWRLRGLLPRTLAALEAWRRDERTRNLTRKDPRS